MPVFDYMDVVGRATQEAKAESRYPVNDNHQYSFLVLVSPLKDETNIKNHWIPVSTEMTGVE